MLWGGWRRQSGAITSIEYWTSRSKPTRVCNQAYRININTYFDYEPYEL